MKPDAPAEVRGKFRPDPDQRARHPDLRAFPADGADDGQGGADPQPPSQDRRHARERPALDDDRPRLQRRQRPAAHRQRDLARLRAQGRSAGQRRPARTDRQHRRRQFPRPDGGLPRQRPRAVLPQRRSRRCPTSRSATSKFPPARRPSASTPAASCSRRSTTSSAAARPAARRCTTAPTNGPSAC